MLPVGDKENVGAVHNSSKTLRSPLTPARHGLAFRQNLLERNSIALSAGTPKKEGVVCNVTAGDEINDAVAVEASQSPQTTERSAEVLQNVERDASAPAADPLRDSIEREKAAMKSPPMQADMSRKAQMGLQRTAHIHGAASKEHPAGKSVFIHF